MKYIMSKVNRNGIPAGMSFIYLCWLLEKLGVKVNEPTAIEITSYVKRMIRT